MVRRRPSAEEASAPAGAPRDDAGQGSNEGPRGGDEEGEARSAGPSLTVAAVARRLGVAPATLRTWDRRYGLGPSEHLAGSHRRYSSSDVSRLLVMRRLTLEGVAPSEAARAALDAPDAAAPTVEVGIGADVIDAFSDAVPMAPDPPALVSAAGHFDNAAVRWMLARVHPRDVLAWWTELVEPALRALRERPVVERPGESAAPALVAAAFAELRSRAAVASARAPGEEGVGTPTVLAVPVGAAGSGLLSHVLAAALQGQGVRARVLSDAGPSAAATVVEQVRPAAVVLDIDAGVPDAEATAFVQSVVAPAPDMPLFVHRTGAGTVDLPGSGAVHRVRTVTGALHEILAVVR